MHLPRCLALVLALSCALPACRKPPPPPENVHVQVQSYDLSLVGATLVGGGKRKRFEKAPWQTSRSIALAVIELPPGTAVDLARFSIEVPTPCGPKSLGKLPVKTSRETWHGMFVEAGAASLPPLLQVWTDAAAARVKVGEAEVATGETALFDPACKAEVPVTADGASIGALPASEGKKLAVFVTARKDTCYELRHLGYGPGSPTSAPTRYRDAQVYRLEIERIDFFLKLAPARARSPQTLTELTSIPCEEAK